ncbi:hypothetical protein QNO00_02900 [Arthrobacter sp. zg-Y1219]|uniref:hypothetical protein n=1 Tax=Arthrobacter sp. zg-Y1219 TaxID=3049067 RepID=UPI0024C3528E|nr:hypothetical protein [Arthrobacter sp. zg-Y1219]MDK1359219.1 hypothetical protein [Arthrobacter sp. zg-Y1219]
MTARPETPPTGLVLADPQVTADLRTFVIRSRAADDGAVRLQAVGAVLAAYVCVLRPRALGEDLPTVLGMRTMPLAEPASLDTVVSLASIADRLARMGETDTVLPVPPMTVTESWTGVGAPRSGWERGDDVPFKLLEQAAHRGIREVAALVPASAGAPVVNTARGAVWGRPLPDTAAAIPAGAAFAALTLGFLPGEGSAAGGSAATFRCGRWTRLSMPRGHVLVRSASVLEF